MFLLRDFAIAVAVGTILLLLLSRLIGGVQFSLGTAFWCSFIGHVLLSLIGAISGFIFYSHLGIGLLIGLAVGCVLQAIIFQIAVRAKRGTLFRFRALVLSLIVILGDIFVASPLIEFRGQILAYFVSGSKGKLFLAIALGLALLNAAMKPLSDGLCDTSMWAAKLMAPPDIGECDDTKQFLKFGQAALMEGWLSNVPFISSILFFSSLIVAFFYHWWAPIVVFFVPTIVGVFLKLFWGGSVSYYLSFIHHKLVHRVANYKRDNDFERADAGESMLRDLEQIMAIYHGSRLRPPTPKQLKNVPYGDLYYWLETNTGGA
jgi:hypothetical protein